MQLSSLKATDAGSDVLLVVALVDEFPGRVFEAHGWVSALSNHYDQGDYDQDGHRAPKSVPRAMTSEEQRAYCQGLLAEQNEELAGLRLAPEAAAAEALVVLNPDVLDAVLAAQTRGENEAAELSARVEALG